MSRSDSTGAISNTEGRGVLLFPIGIVLLVYSGTQWFGYVPSAPWFVYIVFGIGLFAWGIYQLQQESD